MSSILIIDDEPDIRWVLKRILEEDGHDVAEVHNGYEGLSLLGKEDFDLVILDLRMPEVDGMTILRKIKSDFHDTVVIILTAHNEVSAAVEATKLGAFDFLVKPADEETLKVTVNKGLEHARLQEKLERLEGLVPKILTGPIIGNSAAVQRAITLVKKVAPADIAVLLNGESGTGKELFATMIHKHSRRKNNPFIPVDGGAFPDSLAEHELFGSEKGAFTGADKRRVGKFELAHQGTLFLDEIGNMNLDVQAKILRAIEQKKIYRVGGKRLVDVDVRIITATNANLEEMVRKGRFREDLYYRLNAFTIDIPALRERLDDIPLLVSHFISKLNLGEKSVAISEDALDILKNYHWPGNIRELKNCIERAVLITNGEIIPDDLPTRIMQKSYDHELDPGYKTLKEAGEWGARREEEKLIRQTLNEKSWNRAETANTLGIDVKTLYNKMKKYGINE